MNAQRLLGSILQASMSGGIPGVGGSRQDYSRRHRRSSNILGFGKAQIGMGILAGAVAAYDHFSKSRQSSPATAPGLQPGEPPAPPPEAPPSPPGAVVDQGGTLPDAPPPPPMEAPPPPPAAQDANDAATVIIRAMVSAAAADGEMAAEAQHAIRKKLEEGGLTDEERAFIENEMANPLPVEQIAAQLRDPSVARQAYIASLLAIEVDTDAEREHMSKLASLTGLDEATVSLLHQATGD